MFKPGDFLRNKNGTTDYDCYINSDSGIEYACTYIYNGSVGFYNHTYAHTHLKIHPTLGIDVNDKIDIDGAICSNISVSSSYIYQLSHTSTFITYFQAERILLTRKNIIRPHWNTCAQHRLNIQNSTITPTQPVVTTSFIFQINDKIEYASSVPNNKQGTILSIDYITNEYEVSWNFCVSKETKAYIENNYKLQTSSQNTFNGAVIMNPFYTTGLPDLPKGAWVDSFSGNESCNHEWKVYTGFNEFYNFCSKCDVKQTKE